MGGEPIVASFSTYRLHTQTSLTDSPPPPPPPPPEEFFTTPSGELKPLGITRISFGASSTIDDVLKFVAFVKKFFLVNRRVERVVGCGEGVGLGVEGGKGEDGRGEGRAVLAGVVVCTLISFSVSLGEEKTNDSPDLAIVLLTPPLIFPSPLQPQQKRPNKIVWWPIHSLSGSMGYNSHRPSLRQRMASRKPHHGINPLSKKDSKNGFDQTRSLLRNWEVGG